MKRLMRLWGKGARAEDTPPEETEEEKAAREQTEKDKAEKDKAEKDKAEKDKAESGDDLEDEEDEEDEATKAAATAVPAKVRASIVRSERTRIHAIVDGGGRDRVETSLRLALGTNLTAKAALAIVATTAASPPAESTVPAGGRLGLGGEMATRHKPQLGPAATPAGGPQTEVDKAAASILKHVSKVA